jgi:hypothetical protein
LIELNPVFSMLSHVCELKKLSLRQLPEEEMSSALEKRVDAQQCELADLRAMVGADDDGQLSAFKVRVGGWLSKLSVVIILLQFNVWLSLMLTMGAQADDNGHYRKKFATAKAAMHVGSMLNAAAVALVIHFALGRSGLLAANISYVVWFTTNAVLHMVNMPAKLRAGDNYKAIDAAFDGKLFRAFGVAVFKVTADDVAVPLYFLVSLVPAIVAGFLTQWFSVAKYESDCSPQWTKDMDDISSCTSNYGVCCKMVDVRYNYFTFIAYLSGNVLAAYAFVSHGAMCLLAKAKADGTVEERMRVNLSSREVV